MIATLLNEIPRPVPSRPVISRTTILILAATLLAMGIGAHLSISLARACLLFGGFGILAYGILEAAAHLDLRRRNSQEAHRFGNRLDHRVAVEQTIHSTRYGRADRLGQADSPQA